MARKKEPSYETEKYPFPTQLRILMEATGTKQSQLAKAIGVRPQTVSLYALGQSFPDVNRLTKIADFFNVSSDYLLGINPESSRNQDIQTVCNYTGLSPQAVKSICHYGGNIRVLNSLLENPDMKGLLFQIFDLAIQKTIGAALNLTGNKLDIDDVEARILPDYKFREEIAASEYQVSIRFKDIVDSFIQESVSDDAFRGMMLQAVQRSFLGSEIQALKNISKSELRSIMEQISSEEMLQNRFVKSES